MIGRFLKAGFGGAGAQFVHLAFLPVLSRIYSPEAYAGWALVMVTATLIGSIACLRLELAIVLPRDEVAGRATFWLAVTIAPALSLALLLIMMLPGVAGVLTRSSAEQAPSLVWLVPLLTLLFNLTLSLQSWCVRQQAFAIQSFSAITLATLTNGAHFLLGTFQSSDDSSLLLGTILGQANTILPLVGGLVMMDLAPSPRGLDWRMLLAAARTYRGFIVFSTPYTLLNFLKDRTAIYFLEAFLGREQVGHYAFAQRIMSFPVNLVAGSLRPVFFQAAAEEGMASVEPRVQKVMIALAVLASLAVMLFVFNPAALFVTAFGPSWGAAGEMGLFLIWPAYTLLFATWLDRFLDVLGKQRLAMVLQSIFCVGGVMAMAAGYRYFGMTGGLLGECLAAVASNLTFLLVVFRCAGFSRRGLIRPASIAIMTLACSAIVLVPLKAFLPLWWQLGVYLVACGCALAIWRRRWLP